ncbi:MAG: DUF1015 family protein [Syntrophomonas sp.]|nr:DUF1015 family protein [Syntrophomonas sp.]
MAVIRPFRALRPIPELASKVAALPYDVMSSEEAREMVKENPCSFLHVDKAEITLDQDVDLYDVRVYEKARENLQGMIDNGILTADDKPCLYIYRLIMQGRAQTGIVACTSIDEYLHNIIKKHELTRADKEMDRTRHVDYCDANTGPIFLTYRFQAEINEVVADWTKKKPVYDFQSDDGIGHIVWIIDQEDVINRLMALFKQVEYLYIADGHHRCASAVGVGQLRRQTNPDYTGEEEFNYFLSVIFPDQDLYIMDYNRVVKDLNGLSPEQFLQHLSSSFSVTKAADNHPFKPQRKHSFGMYMQGHWYQLDALEGSFDLNDPVARLDVSIMQNNILASWLGIEDPRTDKRIDFVGGIRGLKELERRVDDGMQAAFSMFPPTIQDLMDIADSGQIMPPKSTWFEPKLRSGLFIHKLS